jgi:hypothetical protein
MNPYLYAFNKQIKLARRKYKRMGIVDIGFVMNRVSMILFGDGFENTPRISIDPEGVKYMGVRLFFDPSLPPNHRGYFFDYEQVLSKYKTLTGEG